MIFNFIQGSWRKFTFCISKRPFAMRYINITIMGWHSSDRRSYTLLQHCENKQGLLPLGLCKHQSSLEIITIMITLCNTFVKEQMFTKYFWILFYILFTAIFMWISSECFLHIFHPLNQRKCDFSYILNFRKWTLN
jgi:hypothetical protein